MMKVRLLAFCAVIAAAAAVAAAAVAAAAVAADGPAYTFSMRVGNSQAEQSVSKGGGKKSKGGSTKTKTTERSLSWPVSVSVHGASRPSEDAVKLMCYFIGTTDGSPAMLGEQKVDVKRGRTPPRTPQRGRRVREDHVRDLRLAGHRVHNPAHGERQGREGLRLEPRMEQAGENKSAA